MYYQVLINRHNIYASNIEVLVEAYNIREAVGIALKKAGEIVPSSKGIMTADEVRVVDYDGVFLRKNK